MLFRKVGCAHCRRPLPRGPGILGFAPAPRRLTCSGCGAVNDTGLPAWRYAYYFRYAWKLWVLGAVLRVGLDALERGGLDLGAMVRTIGLAGVVLGFAASLVFAFPVWFVLEVVGSVAAVYRGERSAP